MHGLDGLGPIYHDPAIQFLLDDPEIAGTHVAVEVNSFGVEPVQCAASRNAAQAYLDGNVNVDTHVGLYAIGGNPPCRVRGHRIGTPWSNRRSGRRSR